MEGFWVRMFPQRPTAGGAAGADEDVESVRRVESVEGIPWRECFPLHKLIICYYYPHPYIPDAFTVVMKFFKNAVPPADIVSIFFRWQCGHCGRAMRRFISHQILLPCLEGTILHYSYDRPDSFPVSLTPQYPYDPNAHGPFFRDVLANLPVLDPVEPNILIMRFLLKPCHVCRTEHWYLIQGVALNRQQDRLVHFCCSDRLDYPLTVAAHYRSHRRNNMEGFWVRVLPPQPSAGEEEVEFVRFEFANGIPWREYFPHHQLILSEYHKHPDIRNAYTGVMSFFPRTLQPPDIVSRFFSWHCDRCGRTLHRFTDHQILPPGGPIRVQCSYDNPHNVIGSLTAQNSYDPDADGRLRFHDVLANLPVFDTVEPHVLIMRFLIKPCRACRIEHWYLIQGVVLNRLQDLVMHFCCSDSLDSPLAVAAYYRLYQ